MMGQGVRPLVVEFCGLELRHPVINGSGTFDAIAARRAFGDQLLDQFPFSAFVSKTITPEPRAGNPPPRLWETPSGLINSIGLPNKGLDGFLEHDLPELAELPVPLIVSVMGTSHEEFARLVDGVGGREEVAALELNVSCPNVKSGLIVGESPEEARSLLATAATPDRKTPAREAHSEHRRPGSGRPRGRGGRGRCDLVDQHASGRRLRPGFGRPLARRRNRRPLGAVGPDCRPGPDPRCDGGSLDPGRGDGRHLEGP